MLPVEASDFAEKIALYLPREAQYSYLVNLPANISAQNLTSAAGQKMNSLGEVVNNAMDLVEAQSEQLSGVLPKDYTIFSDELTADILMTNASAAAGFIGGASLSGNALWHDEEGRSLKQIEG
ncbi:MAG: DUF4357 domain-containing protein [Lachnospiraceae bacterium]|nr:DUF4357 domain-containing protein [Lachnospiraceae bacterium]